MDRRRPRLAGGVATFVSALISLDHVSETYVRLYDAEGPVGGSVVGLAWIGILATVGGAFGWRLPQKIVAVCAGAAWGCLMAFPLSVPPGRGDWYYAWERRPAVWTALGGGAVFAAGALLMLSSGARRPGGKLPRWAALAFASIGAGLAIAASLDVQNPHLDPRADSYVNSWLWMRWMGFASVPGKVLCALLGAAWLALALAAYVRARTRAVALVLFSAALGLAAAPLLAAAGANELASAPRGSWTMVAGAFAATACAVLMKTVER